MGTTIEDVAHEMHLHEQWESERKDAYRALEKIANSETVKQLQNNLVISGKRNQNRYA